mmetsp:Transcript_16171/g.43907  ORF Transcript_16171/g.43907 Transcript_16171/m.43907 type:complete len:322 (-) Transcript_16171:24-989(-)
MKNSVLVFAVVCFQIPIFGDKTSISPQSLWLGRNAMSVGGNPPIGIGREFGESSNLGLRGGKGKGKGRPEDVTAKKMRDKTHEELIQIEEKLRSELVSLNTAKQVGGQPSKVNRIRGVRKAIARVLYVHNNKMKLEHYLQVKKDKHKPIDARMNRHWTRAMRRRMSPYQMMAKSARGLRCIKHKIWGGGERPMRKVLGFSSPLDDVKLGFHPPDEFNNLYRYPRYRLGAHGRSTHTKHVPEHAQKNMDKKKSKWEQELKRVQSFRDKMRERRREAAEPEEEVNVLDGLSSDFAASGGSDEDDDEDDEDEDEEGSGSGSGSE